jgi:hypothetical protein
MPGFVLQVDRRKSFHLSINIMIHIRAHIQLPALHIDARLEWHRNYFPALNVAFTANITVAQNFHLQFDLTFNYTRVVQSHMAGQHVELEEV